MKKGYIIIIVIVLLVVIVVIMGKGKKLEAPTTSQTNNGTKMDMTPSVIPSDFNAAVTSTTAPVKEFTVTGQNFSFTPASLSVKKGDHVKIVFKNGGGFHDLKIDEFKVATHQIKTGESETIEFIADKTGSFEYYCSVGTHRAMGMKGTLVVE